MRIELNALLAKGCGLTLLSGSREMARSKIYRHGRWNAFETCSDEISIYLGRERGCPAELLPACLERK